MDQLNGQRAESETKPVTTSTVTAGRDAEAHPYDPAKVRLAIAEEIMRRYPDEFEQQGSTRLLGMAIVILAFAVVVGLALNAEAILTALGL